MDTDEATGASSPASTAQTSPLTTIDTPSSTGVTPEQSGVPFLAASPHQYTNKIKALLTGLAATDEEVVAVTSSNSALNDLVHQWLQTDAATTALEHFFAHTFQQSLVTSAQFPVLIGDGSLYPADKLVMNLRQSFAKTVTSLIAAKQPFTAVANTRQFMLTTAMMAHLAYVASSYQDDSGRLHNRLAEKDPNWRYKISSASPIAVSDTLNSASPNYQNFYMANLGALYKGVTPDTYEPVCRGANGFTSEQVETPFEQGPASAAKMLRSFLNGGYLLWWANDSLGGHNCNLQGASYPQATDADYNDWRMITVRAPRAGEKLDMFYDYPGLRKVSKTELIVDLPAVGYFTTPAFLAQWSTNSANQARVTANQTLIAGLGFAEDARDTLALTTPSAVASAHAADPACFSCHQTLDPLRQFFRKDFSFFFGKQADPNMLSLPATFSFRGVTQSGTGVADLGNIIAGHPDFAKAWVVKVCAWATSSPCQATDPEVLRIAQNFAASNFDFRAMAAEVLTSPLVTYAAPTVSAQTAGQVVSVTRRSQFCQILNARLGLKDICDESTLHIGGGQSIAEVAIALPVDAYGRGLAPSLYVPGVDPFSRNSLENICVQAASMVIDAPSAPWAVSTAVPAAIDKIALALMGTPQEDRATVTTLLQVHYDGARSAGFTPTAALQSTFVVGCASPFVVGL